MEQSRTDPFRYARSVAPNGYRQQVPRPAQVSVGEPPPWAALSASERSSVPFQRFVDAVALDVPTTALDHASAAVLVPVFAGRGDGEATIVLIRRASHLQRDPGHVAFPGGRREPGERPEAAAVREAEEEIGLSRDDVVVQGVLDVAPQTSSGDSVAAFLGILHRPPTLVANASEVDSVFEIPVAHLLSDGVAWREDWGTKSRHRSMKFFADPVVLQDDLIWGVSAHILWNVLERFAKAA